MVEPLQVSCSSSITSHKCFGWMDVTQVGAGLHNPGRGWAGIE